MLMTLRWFLPNLREGVSHFLSGIKQLHTWIISNWLHNSSEINCTLMTHFFQAGLEKRFYFFWSNFIQIMSNFIFLPWFVSFVIIYRKWCDKRKWCIGCSSWVGILYRSHLNALKSKKTFKNLKAFSKNVSFSSPEVCRLLSCYCGLLTWLLLI